MTRFAPKQKLALHNQFADYMAGKRVYPINVEISPCGLCNASCPFCFYAGGELGSHRNVMLAQTTLKKLIDDCSEMGVKSLSWTGGGEPSLYPGIYWAVSWAETMGLEQGMFTNALAMPKYDPSKLSWIRVTMTDKPYKPECIRPLRAAKTLGFAFNYGGPQDDVYLKDTLKLAVEVRADYVQVRPALKFHGQTVDIEPPTFSHPLLQVTDYKFEEAKKRHGYSQCEGYHFSPFVWEDGSVDVCAYHRKDAGYTLGNLYQQSFKEIMDAAPQTVPVASNCQVCCKLHETNRLIHESRQLEEVNFP